MHTPTVEENGWTCSHSVVEVVTDDMPFLVDSVTNELSRQGRGIHVVIHPQVVVRRDVTGKLIEVLARRAATAARTCRTTPLVESWIHVEIDRETDRGRPQADHRRPAARPVRRPRGRRGLGEDARRGAAHRRRAARRAHADDLRDQEVEEARELLRWLADDHFTFLGYREYDACDRAATRWPPCPAPASASCAPTRTTPATTRTATPVSPSFNRLPADARAKAREHKLLILTKANSRATVHRPRYLDYVGVKKFDAEGNVVGERRFLGLFSSAAYTESVRRVPVIRRKVDEVLEGAGFSPNSHDGRDLLQILETYPRDELFQTPVDELRSIVTSVLYLQERRRLRLYLRQDEYGRYYSALVYLPRDRYTTDVRLRLIDILKEELGGTSVDFTACEHRVGPLPAALRRPRPARHRAAAPHRRRQGALEARLVGGRPLLGRRIRRGAERRGAARSAPPSCCAATPTPSPRATRPTTRPRGAVADLRPPGAADRSPARTSRSACTSRSAPAPASAASRSTAAGEPGLALRRAAGAQPAGRRGRRRAAVRAALRGPDAAPGSTTSGCGCRPPRATARLPRRRRPRALPGRVRRRVDRRRRRTTASTRWCWAPGSTWRQAMVLRAYAKYLRQAGSTFSQDYMEDTLLNNVHTTRLLVSLFEARMSPDRQRGRHRADRRAAGGARRARWTRWPRLDEDRILRSFLTVIKATLRTNFFQEDGGRHSRTATCR